MVEIDEIERVATRFAIEANAERVILFGSYARDEANDDSDVDILIIAQSDLPRFKRSRELYKLFQPYPFGMDILVYTPQEVERGARSRLSFISTVLREGKTLYDRGSSNSETVANQGHE